MGVPIKPFPSDYGPNVRVGESEEDKLKKQLEAIDTEIKRRKEARQAELKAIEAEIARREKMKGDVPGAIMDIPGNIAGGLDNFVNVQRERLGQSLEANPNQNPISAGMGLVNEAISGGISDLGDKLADRGLFGTIGDAIKGLYDTTIGAVEKGLESTVAWGLDKLGVDLSTKYWQSTALKGLDTPEARYEAMSESANAAIALGVGVMLHKSIVSGQLSPAREVLGLTSKAGPADIVNAIKFATPEVALEAKNALQLGPGAFFSRVVQEGAGANIVATISDPNFEFSDRPAEQIMNSAVSGAVMALAFEGMAKGFGAKDIPKATKDMIDQQFLTNQLNLGSIFSDASLERIALVNADLPGAISENLKPGQNFILDVADLEVSKAMDMHPKSVAVYKSPHGNSSMLILNDPTPEGAAKLRQFKRNGFYTGMEVDVGGSSMIWERAVSPTKAKVIDPKTGKVLNVDKSQIQRLPTAKDFTVEPIFADANTPPSETVNPKTNTIQGRRTVTLTEIKNKAVADWEALLKELPDDARAYTEAAMDTFYREKTIKAASAIDRLHSRGYYLDVKDNGDIRIASETNPSFSRDLNSALELEAAVDDLTAPVSPSQVVDAIHQDLGITLPQQLGPNRPYSNEGLNLAPGKWQKWWDAVLVRGGTWLTPLPNLVQAFDNRLKTNNRMSTALTALMRAESEAKAVRQSYAAELKPILESFESLTDVEKTLHKKYLETRTWTQFTQKGVYGRKPNEHMIGLIKRLVALGSKHDRFAANRFVNERQRIYEANNAGELSGAQLEADLSNLMEMWGIKEGSPRVEMVKILEQVMEGSFKDADLYTVLEGADLFEFKDEALSRADFVAKHGLSPKFVQTMAKWEEVIRRLGKHVDIDPNMMIDGYFPRFRRYYPGLSANQIIGMSHMPAEVKRFKNALIRTNYYADSELMGDLTLVTSKYLDAAIKTKYLDEHTNNFKKAVSETANMQIEGKYLWDDRTKRALFKISDTIDQSLNSYGNALERLGSQTYDKAIDRISGATDRTKIERDWPTLFMKAMELKAQGFKAVAGVRDATSTAMVYGYIWGPKRLANMINIVRQAVNHKESMKASGLTAGLDPTLFADPNKGPVLGGLGKKLPYDQAKGIKQKAQSVAYSGAEKLDAFVEGAADVGFKFSLQPQVYSFFHAATYLEQTQWISNAVKDFTSGKISKEALHKQIALDMFDPNVRETFKAEMAKAAPDYKAAIDGLAHAAGRMSVGEYTRMSAPLLFNSKAGRLAAQFSRWPLWMTTTLGNATTRGSRGGALARMAFLGGMYYAADRVADETGLDFKRWVLNPLNFLPSGSPIVQAVQSAQEAMDRSGTGQQGAINQTMHMAKYIANPVPIAFMKMLEATQRYDEGQPLDAVLFTLFGGSVNPDTYKKPKLFDF